MGDIRDSSSSSGLVGSLGSVGSVGDRVGLGPFSVRRLVYGLESGMASAVEQQQRERRAFSLWVARQASAHGIHWRWAKGGRIELLVISTDSERWEAAPDTREGMMRWLGY